MFKIRRADFVAAAALLGALLVAYHPCIFGGLLWDDDAHVPLGAVSSWAQMGRIWFKLGATQQYYPVLFSAFWVEHHLWGDSLAGYHLVNIFLHAVSAFLVVALVRQLALPGAWLAGFIFALHPVCVESVAWMTEQKNTLSAVFYLSAALVYLRFDQTRRPLLYGLALVLFLLALFSKTVTATLPGVLLVIFWWQRGKLRWRKDILPLAPYFVIGATAGLFTAWVERKFIGAEGAAFELGWPHRLLLMGRIPWFYFGKVIWPTNLLFIYPRWTISTAVWWQYLFPAAAILVIAALGVLAIRSRGPLAACLIFLGTLLPVSGLLNVYPFLFSYVADHFQYLASLAIIIPLSACVAMAVERLFANRLGWAYAMQGAMVLVLGVLTFRECQFYRDPEKLYRHVLAQNPACWMAAHNLGRVLEGQGRLEEAVAQFESALRAHADFALGHNNLGETLAKMPGRLPDAQREFRLALKDDPKMAIAHYNLGVSLEDTPGGAAEATQEYEAALSLNPEMADAHYNLGTIFQRIPGRLPDALKHFAAAAALRPDYVDAEMNLGVTLAQSGRLPEAIARFESVVKDHPDNKAAAENLAMARELARRSGSQSNP